jgi:hypothetical protein
MTPSNLADLSTLSIRWPNQHDTLMFSLARPLGLRRFALGCAPPISPPDHSENRRKRLEIHGEALSAFEFHKVPLPTFTSVPNGWRFNGSEVGVCFVKSFPLSTMADGSFNYPIRLCSLSLAFEALPLSSVPLAQSQTLDCRDNREASA